MVSANEKGRGAVGQTLVRIWRYAPVLLWIAFIFSASGSGFSFSNTSRVVRPLMLWLFPGISDETMYVVHYLVRKAAHFAEYGLLALLLARAFLTSSRPTLRRHWFMVSFLVVAAFALLDEFRQSFVSSRIGTIYDSLIDMLGGAAALTAILLWRRFRKGRKQRTVSEASIHPRIAQ